MSVPLNALHGTLGTRWWWESEQTLLPAWESGPQDYWLHTILCKICVIVLRKGGGLSLNCYDANSTQFSWPLLPLVWGLIYIWFLGIQNTTSKGYKHKHVHRIQVDCSGVQNCYVKNICGWSNLDTSDNKVLLGNHILQGVWLVKLAFPQFW